MVSEMCVEGISPSHFVLKPHAEHTQQEYANPRGSGHYDLERTLDQAFDVTGRGLDCCQIDLRLINLSF